MKKIDFHIHTVATQSDPDFTFSLEKLDEYVRNEQIDAIAITNHNMFDRNQFIDISKKLKAVVYPGIEIDVEGTHILVIANEKEVDDFADRCKKITELIPTPETSINVEHLIEVFPCLEKHIVIPHHRKKPEIKQETLSKLISFVTAGEVSAPKKFVYSIRDEGSLVPVLFSDIRADEKKNLRSSRQTYVSIGEISFNAIKAALSDKSKVSLSQKEGHSLFSSLGGRLLLSTGLNVLIGERSSGKSFTLDALERENTSADSRVKYIKQFSLLQKDFNDEKAFSQDVKSDHESIVKEYLNPLKNMLDEISKIDLRRSYQAVEKFLETLCAFAYEADKHDSFSKVKMFQESQFNVSDLKFQNDVVKSVLIVLENVVYDHIISRYISKEEIQKMFLELVDEFRKERELELKKSYINSLVSDIKSELSNKSASTQVRDVDLYETIMDNIKVEKFNQIFNLIKTEREIRRVEFHGFVEVAKCRPFIGASDLNKLGNRASFADAYRSYGNSGYDYLEELRKIPALRTSDYHEYIVKVDYEVLNSEGTRVSGGERSEYRLLSEIKDATQYDLLLIDEPESSFDNIFLNQKVNKLIKDISEIVPVVVVTHNNTLGASIMPDYLIYTSKEKTGGEVKYKVYHGFPNDKVLKTFDSEEVKNINITLDCLEAGPDTYNKRREKYELLKN